MASQGSGAPAAWWPGASPAPLPAGGTSVGKPQVARDQLSGPRSLTVGGQPVLRQRCSASSRRDFSWSPGGNIIAFWVPEDKDIPARVTLMQLPTRQEIRVRNLFNVVDCKLHWQKNGDYLCVKVDRTPKGTQVSGCPKQNPFFIAPSRPPTRSLVTDSPFELAGHL